MEFFDGHHLSSDLDPKNLLEDWRFFEKEFLILAQSKGERFFVKPIPAIKHLPQPKHADFEKAGWLVVPECISSIVLDAQQLPTLCIHAAQDAWYATIHQVCTDNNISPDKRDIFLKVMPKQIANLPIGLCALFNTNDWTCKTLPDLIIDGANYPSLSIRDATAQWIDVIDHAAAKYGVTANTDQHAQWFVRNPKTIKNLSYPRRLMFRLAGWQLIRNDESFSRSRYYNAAYGGLVCLMAAMIVHLF